MLITSKGGIFSIDLLAAFLLASALLVLILDFQSGILFSSQESLKGFEVSEKALMLADSLVKNFDENNALLGSAFFDSGKRRVVSNLLDYSSLKTARPAEFSNVSVVELSIQKKNSAKEVVFSKKGFEGKNCISVKRFVILNFSKEKALAGVVACED